MSEKESNAGECGRIRSMLAAFLADELPAGDSRQVQEHLDACPPCERFRRFECAFDGALKRSVGAVPAPASLILKLQRSMDAESTSPASPARPERARQWGGWRQWALAAGIVVALLAPFSVGYEIGLFAPRALQEQTRVVRGTLVCSACEKLGVPIADQRGCRVHGHHAALKCDDSVLWEFVEDDASRDLLTDASRIGDAVELRGVFLDDLHYVKVDSVRFLSGQAQADLGL